MSRPVLLVTGFGVSPAACEDLPAVRAVLDRLRQSFDVTVFHWPTVRGGPDYPPTWQGAARALSEVLPTGGYLVALSGNITYALPVLQDRSAEIRAMVAFGFDIPVATFNALGMESRGHAQEVVAAMDTDFRPGTLPWYEGAAEEDAMRWAAIGLRDGDPLRAPAFARQSQELDLVELGICIQTPTLFFESPLPFPGFAESREIFQRFVPNTEFVWLPHWRQHEAVDGEALVSLAIPFMEKWT
jgi:hypothetical protein